MEDFDLALQWLLGSLPKVRERLGRDALVREFSKPSINGDLRRALARAIAAPSPPRVPVWTEDAPPQIGDIIGAFEYRGGDVTSRTSWRLKAFSRIEDYPRGVLVARVGRPADGPEPPLTIDSWLKGEAREERLSDSVPNPARMELCSVLVSGGDIPSSILTALLDAIKAGRFRVERVRLNPGAGRPKRPIRDALLKAWVASPDEVPESHYNNGKADAFASLRPSAYFKHKRQRPKKTEPPE